VYDARIRWARRFHAYDDARLLATIRDLGVREGDALMVHSSWPRECGFRGDIGRLTEVFLEAVGSSGHLLMPSLPYRTSALAYLQRVDRFDVRKTQSRMGLVTEFFRRRDGVVRSLHPTHPILVFGPRADEFVAGHERCVHACGPGSPFDALTHEHGKVMFFDVSFAAFTYFHYLEHRVHERAGVKLYTDEVFVVPVVDAHGNESVVRTHAFSKEALRTRRFAWFEQQLRKRDIIRTKRVGNSTLEAVDLDDVVACVEAMASEGRFFYDRT
jgi:aminoglycoside 3-N-acetyltransferase